MSGNPFVNFLLQALIELPGFLIARALCDRLGRRWSQAMAFVFGALFQLACIFTVLHREYRYTQFVPFPAKANYNFMYVYT
jgi:hypothetical protein